MQEGELVAICVAEGPGLPMKRIPIGELVVGRGLRQDRYGMGTGSYHRERPWHRQVTLMNAEFFDEEDYEYEDSRRNLFIRGTDVMYLLNREFQLGETWLEGVDYCDPCDRPSNLAGKRVPFDVAFIGRGGLIARVLQGGIIRPGSALIKPPRKRK